MFRKFLKRFYGKMRSDKSGVALVSAFMVVGALVTLSAGLMTSTMTEIHTSLKFRDSTKAFWVASGAIDAYIKNPAAFSAGVNPPVNVGPYPVVITRTDGAVRTVRAEVTINSVSRGIEISYPGTMPSIFSNTMTSGNNLYFAGFMSDMNVHGKTRIGGSYINSSFMGMANYDDKQASQGTGDTTLQYPDADGNGTPDEKTDFEQFYVNEVAKYPSSEAHMEELSGSVKIILPSSDLSGKKIVFYKFDDPGGVVRIYFGAGSPTVQENITIVSNGRIEYVMPMQFAAGSKINTVSWEMYRETSLSNGRHTGLTFTHEHIILD